MIKRIPVTSLEPGMYLHKVGGSWLDHPFWRTSFVLRSSDIEGLKRHGVDEVWIDSSKGLDTAEGTSAEEVERDAEALVVQAGTSPMPLVDAPPVHSEEAGELAKAAALAGRARQAVARLFGDARLGRSIDADHLMPLVANIVESVQRDESALISLVRMKTEDEYTYLHSVAVCALMVALARQLGFNEEQTQRAGLAGLLHDVGKAKIPSNILNKPGKLTETEFAVMKMHPVRGHAVLAKSGRIDPVAMDVCLHHHEKIDGTGYPARLSAEKISLLSRMGAVCDVYDAVTSHRPYKRPWHPADALRQMATWKGHFDPVVFQAFIKAVGIYPVGSLLRLQSGHLAVVVRQTAGSMLRPVVKVFFELERNEWLTPFLLDLSEPGSGNGVQGIAAPEDWDLGDIDHLWLVESNRSDG
jgi:putative nucleotidyltransferase with HDIG domain